MADEIDWKERSQKARAMRKGGALRRLLEAGYTVKVIPRYKDKKRVLGEKNYALYEAIMSTSITDAIPDPPTDKNKATYSNEQEYLLQRAIRKDLQKRTTTIVILKEGKPVAGMEIGFFPYAPEKKYKFILRRWARNKSEYKGPFFAHFNKGLGEELIAHAFGVSKKELMELSEVTFAGADALERLREQGKIRRSDLPRYGFYYNATKQLKPVLRKHRHRLPR